MKHESFNTMDKIEDFMHSNLYFPSYATDFIFSIYYTWTSFPVVLKRMWDWFYFFDDFNESKGEWKKIDESRKVLVSFLSIVQQN